MSRNKPGVLLLLLAFSLLPLSALASSASLISDEMIQAEAANYDTYTVVCGVYEKTTTTSAAEYYPYTYRLRFEQSGAVFEEYLVRRGQEVKAGDALARFSLPSNEVALATRQLSLRQLEESFAQGQLAKSQALSEQREKLTNLTDPYAQALLLLQIQRDEIALEQYCYQQRQTIDTLKAEIAEIEETARQTVLYTPADGVIDEISYKREGDKISTSEVLITLSRTDGMLLRIENKSGGFRFGMPVTVETGRNKTRVQLSGRVVGADTLLPDGRKSGYAYIQLDPYNEEEIRLNNSKAIAPSIYLEQVIVLPRKAVTLNSGKYSVNLLIDGVPRKRFVNYVMQTTSSALVIQGLNPGDIIVID